MATFMRAMRASGEFIYTSKDPFIMKDPETGEVISECEHLGILIEKADPFPVLLKHGDYAKLEGHKQLMEGAFEEAGIDTEFELIDATHADLDDINFVIERSAIPYKYYERLKVIDSGKNPQESEKTKEAKKTTKGPGL